MQTSSWASAPFCFAKVDIPQRFKTNLYGTLRALVQRARLLKRSGGSLQFGFAPCLVPFERRKSKKTAAVFGEIAKYSGDGEQGTTPMSAIAYVAKLTDSRSLARSRPDAKASPAISPMVMASSITTPCFSVLASLRIAPPAKCAANMKVSVRTRAMRNAIPSDPRWG